MKKILTIALIMMMALTAWGKPAEASEEVLKVGYLCQTQDFPFHNAALNSTKTSFEEAGVEFLYQVVGTDSAKIRTAYDTFVTQGCNVIIDFTAAPESSMQLARLSEEKGVFHIAVNCIDAVDCGSNSYFFGLDDGGAGDIMGEESVKWLAENIEGKVDKVIEVNAKSLGGVTWSRTHNAVERIMSEYPELAEEDVVPLDQDNYDVAAIRQKVQDYLTTCKDDENIVVYCLSSSWNPAIISASSALGLDDKLYLFSVDGVDETIISMKSVHDGLTTSVLKGEVVSRSDHYGPDLLKACNKLIAGEEIPRYIYATNGWVTADNAYELFPDDLYPTTKVEK